MAPAPGSGALGAPAVPPDRSVLPLPPAGSGGAPPILSATGSAGAAAPSVGDGSLPDPSPAAPPVAQMGLIPRIHHAGGLHLGGLLIPDERRELALRPDFADVFGDAGADVIAAQIL